MYICIISYTYALHCKYIYPYTYTYVSYYVHYAFLCVGSVNSLISGNPYNNINVNTVANDYREIFTNIVTRDRVS